MSDKSTKEKMKKLFKAIHLDKVNDNSEMLTALAGFFDNFDALEKRVAKLEALLPK